MIGLRIVCLMMAAPVLALGGEPSLAEMAARFREYRVEMRDENSRMGPEIRTWNGPVHKLMADIGRRLEEGHYSSREVVRLLGEPDKIMRAGARHNRGVIPRGESHLVYWWRGGHDYMYLVVRRGRVVESRWWFAYE